MSKTFIDLAISLDGYIAGPNGRAGNPLGDGGLRLHEWMFKTAEFLDHLGQSGGEAGPDNDLVEHVFARAGAYVLGKNMFNEGEVGWPEKAPFRAPVFVLTHTTRAMGAQGRHHLSLRDRRLRQHAASGQGRRGRQGCTH